jgi:transcriptional regulator with XRE-family HTH domain
MDISDSIKDLRLKFGLTQAEFGRQLGVSDKLVSKWERGASVPNIDVLVTLYTLYHIDLYDFLHINDHTETASIEERNQKLIEQFRKFSPKKQRALLTTLDWPEDISD